MAKFAVCDWSDVVWQIDADNPTLPPYPVHTGSGNVQSLAFTVDKEFELICGPSDAEIHKTQGPKADVPVYVEPLAYQVYLSKVRVRMIGFGQERVYFSSYDTSQGAQQIGEQIYQISFLENGSAVPYVTVYPSQLTIPNPCKPSQEIPAYMSGDFTFGDGNTLYLSTGNLGGTNGMIVKAGIYRVDGALPNTVTGNVQRIYLGVGPISGLCYRSPQTLYFLRGYDICSLDLNTLTESTLCTIPPDAGWPGPRDLAYVGDGLKQATYWPIFSGTYLALKLLAKSVWKFGIAITIGGRRIPPRPRERRPDTLTKLPSTASLSDPRDRELR